MKRTISEVYNNTRSKNPFLHCGLNTSFFKRRKTEWISATKLYNYMQDDPIIDWFKNSVNTQNRSRSYSELTFSENTQNFEQYIKNKGIEFENNIVKYINDHINEVKTVSSMYNKKSVKKTIEYMKQGTPIIHSASLSNTKNNTYGIADILIRSDYIKKICQNVEVNNVGCKFSNKWHYVVIDIKYSTIPLDSKKRCILNSGSYKAYKAQLWVYNNCIGNIQNYTPEFGYILGRRWRSSSSNVNYASNNCFDKLGIVEFNKKDKKIISKAKSALKWVRTVKKNGYKWSVYPPTVNELYPNMTKISSKWHSQKMDIANQIGEISSLWMCGLRERNKAFENGIKSWHDPRACSRLFGIKGDRGKIIDKMININKQNTDKFLPAKIKFNDYDWKNRENDIYLDFETFNDIFEDFEYIPEQKSFNILFLIGVGFMKDNKWEFKYFISQKPDMDNEYKIMNEFMMFLKDNFDNPNIYYWHAEKSFWNRSCNQQFDRVDLNEEDREKILDWNIDDNLRDLRKFFVDNKIVIKDCFSYSLKKIAHSMKKHQLINTPIESECLDGLTAMIKAWKTYKTIDNPVNSVIMKDIIKYNEFDCKLLCDILNYIRAKH